MSIEVNVLGPIEFIVDGDAVQFTSPRLRQLLALLVASANTLVPAERLVDVIWPDGDEVQALRVLRTNVWRLRNLMGADAEQLLATRPGGYLLALPDDALDADRFASLAEAGAAQLFAGDATSALDTFDVALGLWRGAAFEGYESDEWARPLAVRLERMHVTVSERRIESLLALGRTDVAIADLAGMVAHEPLRERTQALYMTALYRSQQQAEALRSYSEYRSALAEELGVEPSPSLRQLEHAILNHDLSAIADHAPTFIARGYELFEAVATTPVTVTYRAKAPRRAELVLLTIVDRAVSCDPSYVQVFEVESQRMSSVEHANLVPTTDCWRDGDGAYFVTPAGCGIEPTVGVHVDAQLFVRVVEEVVGAVHHLHLNGLAHGRLGGATIQLDPAGHPSIRPGGLATGLRQASTRDDQRDLARWLLSIAPADLSADARDVLTRGGSQRNEERFDSVLDFGNALTRAVMDEQIVISPAFALSRNPYVGLRSFQESDAVMFFGRDSLIKSLTHRLALPGVRSRLLAVIGASGGGKSSAVRAGLVPALREGAVDGSVDWFVAMMTPGDTPFASLRAALETVAIRPLGLFDELRAEGDCLLARCVAESLPAGGTLLLIVDQAEEIFSGSVNVGECREFLDVIMAAAIDIAGPVRIVLTLRADFYDRPLQYPQFGQLLHECHVVATTLTGDDIAAAIEGPAGKAGLMFEPGLVRALIADFEANPSLPLLQHTLAELCDRREGNLLTLDAYDAVGGLVGSVAHRAEALFGGYPTTDRPLVRRLFTRLVALGDGAIDTRRRVQRRELDSLADNAATVDAVLERFGNARLVTFDHDRESRQPTVEIAHEALITRWGRLAAWIDEDREGLRLIRHLTAAADAWNQRGCDASELYRGARLESVSAWAATHPGELGSAECEFLIASEDLAEREERERASRAEQQQRQHRRLKRLSAAVACAAVVALVAGAVARVQARHADDRRVDALNAESAAAAQTRLADQQRIVALDAQSSAESRRVEAEQARDESNLAQRAAVLAQGEADNARARSDINRLVAQAVADADDTPARSLLLAAAAYDLSPSLFTAGAMQSAIVAQPAGFLGFLPSGETAQVKVGATVIVRQTYASVEIVDRSTLKVRLVIPDPTTNTRVALSADDRYVAMAGPTVRVFDVADGALISTVSRDVPATYLDFDPADPSHLAVGYDDGRAEVVAWRTGSTVARLEQQGDLVRVIEYSPDGKYLATATGSHESAVRIWDASTGLATTGNLGVPGTVLYHADLAFDRSGTRLASVDRGGVGRVWSVPSGELLSRTAATYGVESLGSLEFVSDDVIMASGPSGLLRRWSAVNGADLGVVEPHAGLVASIAIDPARRLLVVGGLEQLALFDLSGTSPGHSVDPYPSELGLLIPDGAAVQSTISANGQIVAVLAGGNPWIWDRTKGSAGSRPVPAAATGVPLNAIVSPDGTLLVIPYLDYSRGITEIVVFDVATLAVLHTIESPRGAVLEISPDNRWLAISYISYPLTPALELYDLSNGRRSSLVEDLNAVTEDVDPLRGAWVSSLSFSSDSRLFAAANHRGAAMIWDLATMKPVGDPLSRGDGKVLDLQFGRSGAVIAIASQFNVISILDVASRELVTPTMSSPSGLSLGLAMNDSGTRLLSGGSDGIRLWDVPSASAIGRPYPVPTPLGPSMFWSSGADSFGVVTDRGVETWTTDPSQWRAEVCDLAGRSLTGDEWLRFGTDAPTPSCRR